MAQFMANCATFEVWIGAVQAAPPTPGAPPGPADSMR